MENHKQHNLGKTEENLSEERGFIDDETGSNARINKNLSIKGLYEMNDTEFKNIRGQKFGRRTFSTLISGSLYSAAATDFLIGVTHLSYAPTVGLPRPKDVGVGKHYIIKDEAGGAGTTTITIRSIGEENIDGASSATITENYGLKELYTDGANWFTRSSTATVTPSNTVTLTNKRVNKRYVTVTQSATPTINTDNTDIASITALAQAITSFTTNLSGTPVAGNSLIIEITDDGTARALAWGASFEASTVALPTTTVISTKLTVGFIWNSATSKWRCVATA